MLSLCYGASCCVNVGQKIIFGAGSRLIIEASKCCHVFISLLLWIQSKLQNKDQDKYNEEIKGSKTDHLKYFFCK